MLLDPLPPARALAVAIAPADKRRSLHALFALDLRLAGIVQAAREPMIGQMRLAWWHDALTRLDAVAAPVEPLLQALQRHALSNRVRGQDVANLVDGWEALIAADVVDDATLTRYADSRGALLFGLAGRVLGDDSPLLAPAGRAWAFADLAGHLTMHEPAALAKSHARQQWTLAFSKRWPRSLRPIGMLSLLAYLGDRGESPIADAIRTTRFRLRGR